MPDSNRLPVSPGSPFALKGLWFRAPKAMAPPVCPEKTGKRRGREYNSEQGRWVFASGRVLGFHPGLRLPAESQLFCIEIVHRDDLGDEFPNADEDIRLFLAQHVLFDGVV